MKLHAIALATLAVTAAGSACAVRVTVTDANRINMTGASALRNSIAGTVYSDICAGATDITLYNLTRPGGPGNTGSNPLPTANFWGITCTLNTAFNGIAAGTPIAFFKSDQGGSGQGVYPLIDPANLNKPQVNVDTTQCTNPNVTVSGVSTPNPAVADVQYTGCATDVAKIVHFGVSDIEPEQFIGADRPKDQSYNEALLQNNDLNKSTVVQTVFAVAVNRNLYEALQTAQGIAPTAACALGATTDACLPSIGKAQAATFFAGFAADWSVLGVANPSNQINICRRVDGSGTQASSNRHLLTVNCNAAALSPADVGFSSPAVAPLSPTANAATVSAYITANVKNTAGATFVFEGPGTGDVISCLNQAQTVGGYGIGHVSRENAIGADWRHVRLDGVVPNRDNARLGRYDYLFESTIQYSAATFNNPAKTNANQQKFITGLTNVIGTSASLSRLSAAAQQGVISASLAVPVGDPFGSRVSRNGNSCSPLTLVR